MEEIHNAEPMSSFKRKEINFKTVLLLRSLQYNIIHEENLSTLMCLSNSESSLRHFLNQFPLNIM